MPRPLLPKNVAADAAVGLVNLLSSASIHLSRGISRDGGAEGVTGASLSTLSVLVRGRPQALGSLARRERLAAQLRSLTPAQLDDLDRALAALEHLETWEAPR